jgi:hypothetical protein
MANANVPFPGYETLFGNKKSWLGDHYGPASYATGGETFSASSLGWGGLEFVRACFFQTETVDSIPMVVPVDESGTYFVGIKKSTTANGAVASVTIQWYVVSTGAEVSAATNLSTYRVTLEARGV